jgi:arylsulfatase A-like enzyme
VHDGITTNEVPHSSPENPKDIFGINDRAFDFMQTQVESDTPFYLQLSHYAVHSPTEARESSKALFKNVRSRGKDDAAGRAAMTYDIDDSIGLLRAKIEALGIANNTYLVVMSDNGGNGGGPRRNRGTEAALNAGKGSLLEGGIRVPFFAMGPGIEAGSISRESITGCDLFPTFCDWTNTDIPNGLEGRSLSALLSGQITELPERSLLFHYPHYGQGPRQKPQSALILGDYKILYDWESQTAQLFNLSNDLGEQTDLSEREPEKAKAMLALLNQRLKEIDASLPQPNPSYDPNATVPTGRKKK